jgi:hypothetical protein
MRYNATVIEGVLKRPKSLKNAYLVTKKRLCDKKTPKSGPF